MPISITVFEKDGKEVSRSLGQTQKAIMQLLNTLSDKGTLQAFSLDEVANVANVDLSINKEEKNLMNTLYNMRIKSNKIIMKEYNGVKHYSLI